MPTVQGVDLTAGVAVVLLVIGLAMLLTLVVFVGYELRRGHQCRTGQNA